MKTIKTERKKFYEFVEGFYKQAFDIIKKKNDDYSQESNPFSNFEFTALASGIKTEQVFLMQIANKLARLRECLDKPVSVLDETLTDTLQDTMNYCVLLAGYINKNLDISK